MNNVPREALGSSPSTAAVTPSVPTVETLPFAHDPFRSLSLRSQTEIWWEIVRLFRDLNALPGTEKPQSNGEHCGPRYLALEAQIRHLSEEYKTLERATLSRVA